MKQKDIVLIVVVAGVSLVLASVLSGLIFGSGGANRNLQAEVVQPISGELEQPSTKYFNDQSVNPTELIRIQTNANQTPFNQAQ